MRSFLFYLASFLIVLLTISSMYAQQFQPEDVLYTSGQHQLKFKHFLAYTNIEMEGEDPALLNDQTYMKALTAECIDEFAEGPKEFVQDMDQHYQAMQNGAGFQMGQAGSNPTNQQMNKPYIQNQTASSNANLSGSGGQWKQLLSGSALYTTAIQSSDVIFVQNTQIMYLCPNGVAYNYSVSGGGGNFAGIDITDPRNMNFEGSFNWNVIEQGGISYFQFSMQGVTQATPISVVNNKIAIQGLGNFSIQQGGAPCQ